uniref:Uncharacterized protein n=1 Tax=Opuntia streptacantha TaxID=393608 RepID=A0A7C8YIU1_OPUST
MKKPPDPSIFPSSVLPRQLPYPLNRDQNSFIHPLFLTSLCNELAFLCPPSLDAELTFLQFIISPIFVVSAAICTVLSMVMDLLMRSDCSSIGLHQAGVHGLTSTHAPPCDGTRLLTAFMLCIF